MEIKANGRKQYAVLVGINYKNSKPPQPVMEGSINDVKDMRQVLINRFKFDSDNIEMITDEQGSRKMPTGKNIKAALNRMINNRAKPGDVLVFHYSGHGTIIPSNTSPTNKDEEAIIPWDSNLITCVDFRQMVDKLPKDATFTFLADSCHSGGLIDQEKEQIGLGHRHYPVNDDDDQPEDLTSRMMIPFEYMLNQLSSVTGLNTPNIGPHLLHMFGPDASAMFRIPPHQFPQPLKPDEGILLSACRSYEKARDGKIGGKHCGAFTYAVRKALTDHPQPLTNKELVLRVREIVESKLKIRDQHPCLYCSDKNVYAIFLSETVAP